MHEPNINHTLSSGERSAEGLFTDALWRPEVNHAWARAITIWVFGGSFARAQEEDTRVFIYAIRWTYQGPFQILQLGSFTKYSKTVPKYFQTPSYSRLSTSLFCSLSPPLPARQHLVI
jgi:hypothetical protein